MSSLLRMCIVHIDLYRYIYMYVCIHTQCEGSQCSRIMLVELFLSVVGNTKCPCWSAKRPTLSATSVLPMRHHLRSVDLFTFFFPLAISTWFVPNQHSQPLLKLFIFFTPNYDEMAQNNDFIFITIGYPLPPPNIPHVLVPLLSLVTMRCSSSVVVAVKLVVHLLKLIKIKKWKQKALLLNIKTQDTFSPIWGLMPHLAEKKEQFLINNPWSNGFIFL